MLQTIIIENEVYQIKFGFGAHKILANMWGFEHLGKIGEKLMNQLQFEPGVEPRIDQIETIGDLVYSGIKNAQPLAQITPADVCDVLFSDPDKIGEILTQYGESTRKIMQPAVDKKKVIRVKH